MTKVLDQITPLDPNDDYLIFDTKYGNTAEVVNTVSDMDAISPQRAKGKLVIVKDTKPYSMYLGNVDSNDKISWEQLGYIEENAQGSSFGFSFDGGNSRSKYNIEQNLDGGDAFSVYSPTQELDFGNANAQAYNGGNP